MMQLGQITFSPGAMTAFWNYAENERYFDRRLRELTTGDIARGSLETLRSLNVDKLFRDTAGTRAV